MTEKERLFEEYEKDFSSHWDEIESLFDIEDINEDIENTPRRNSGNSEGGTEDEEYGVTTNRPGDPNGEEFTGTIVGHDDKIGRAHV